MFGGKMRKSIHTYTVVQKVEVILGMSGVTMACHGHTLGSRKVSKCLWGLKNIIKEKAVEIIENQQAY